MVIYILHDKNEIEIFIKHPRFAVFRIYVFRFQERGRVLASVA